MPKASFISGIVVGGLVVRGLVGIVATDINNPADKPNIPNTQQVKVLTNSGKYPISEQPMLIRGRVTQVIGPGLPDDPSKA